MLQSSFYDSTVDVLCFYCNKQHNQLKVLDGHLAALGWHGYPVAPGSIWGHFHSTNINSLSATCWTCPAPGTLYKLATAQAAEGHLWALGAGVPWLLRTLAGFSPVCGWGPGPHPLACSFEPPPPQRQLLGRDRTSPFTAVCPLGTSPASLTSVVLGLTDG